MSGCNNSYLVPFPERPPSSKDFVLRDHQLAELLQSIDPPDHPFLDHPFSNSEDSLRRIALRSSHQRPNPKVPIPRTSTKVSWTKGARVSQACKSCRAPKIKCSGHRPACHRCVEIGIACHYDDRKREKIDKQLSNLNVQLGMLEDLLRDLYPRLDIQSAQHVDRTLGKISSHDRAPLIVPGLPKTYNAPEDPSVTVDYTEEDFNSLGEMQALGFVGEHSEMVWLCRLKYALEQSSATPSTSQENVVRPSVTSINYYNNDWDMGIRDEVDLLERPSQGMADHLVGTYFQIIHPSFPIIGKMTGGNISKDSLTESVPLGYPASSKRSLKRKTALVVAEPLQPNNSLCFLYAASLTILTRKAIDILYAPGAAHKPWIETEVAISSLNDQTDNWLSSLPALYDFKAISKARPLNRQCASLAFHFYSTKLFITQPCLRRLIYRSPEMSNVPIDASGSMTAICIQAAGQLLELLPDKPDLTWLYGVCPWWCALHYFMQSITMILTESFIRTRLGTIRTISTMPKLRKAIAWLKEMSERDVSAQKAWLVCLDFISRHGSKLGLGVDDSL
ncbi:hypothetical protein PENARI_c033G09546 [Penicillium arizonense]|uniref:Zn(2)-C6 fungal-type domain-containing protein n=1 Tax=Penicillium arizonense TaxID=1835702 RepID=A0A1F5L495_PENAI|nr:hypothetical protein PENARI_c033G09546 [Penicillium arizonense]OGE48054.1 hypothetical protein PENARI_c033G09546 [Penicillium arizonense]